ncbi:MAG: dehydrogenase, partial [Desulfobulbaceae bacterium]|nr:dehydrogenase [Desulfobulbaceae bacterium]
ADLRDIYPSFVIEGLKAAFAQWKDEVPLFISSQAIIMAAETRTSSPVKITRDENFESINTKGLFPLGEGAGYTGGITSSAADAIRAISCHFS